MDDPTRDWVQLDETKAVDAGLIHETLVRQREGTIPFRSGHWAKGPALAVMPRAADCGGGWWVVLWVRDLTEGVRWGIKRLFTHRWEAIEAAKHVMDIIHDVGFANEAVTERLESIEWARAHEEARKAEKKPKGEVYVDALDPSVRAPGSFGHGRRRK